MRTLEVTTLTALLVASATSPVLADEAVLQGKKQTARPELPASDDRIPDTPGPLRARTGMGGERHGLRIDAAWGNDQFYESQGDDVGFTQDASLALHLGLGPRLLSLGVRQRMIVERYGPRRTDEFVWRLAWLEERALTDSLSLSLGPQLELALSGNYGGARLQDAWHRSIGNGYTLEHGLADRYAPHRTGMVLGGRGGPSWLVLPWFRVIVGTEFAAAVGGTGRSRLALYDAIELEPATRGVRPFLSGGIDFERNWTRDPRLRMPGGYGTTRFARLPHLRVALRDEHWEVGFLALSNLGGAGSNLGVFYVMLGSASAFRHWHAVRY